MLYSEAAIEKIYVVKVPSCVLLEDSLPPSAIHWFWRLTHSTVKLSCIMFHLPVIRRRNNSEYFSVWLWTVTRFNTPKNEMSFKVLLVIENGFFRATLEYWIWISKNSSIFRIPAWNECWLLFYLKLRESGSLCFR